MKSALKIVIIFIVGMGGGIFADQIFWPYFVERPLFYEYRLERAPIYITEKKETYIQENIALIDSFEKVEKSVVAISAVSPRGIKIEGSGLIITNDGLLVTLSELVPLNHNFSFYLNGKSYSFQILKRDNTLNLALIKLEGENFLTVGFKNSERIKIGKRVFLVGNLIDGDSSFKIANEGIVRYVDSENIHTNIKEDKVLKGSVLFNIQGEALGINSVGKNGEVFTIPSEKIREFAGF